uniref:Major facilitator superfamily (MFS) profile domain-containing protein n=1 Tax=Panagrolaimus superbus TaxID=310955 RepID=A0A914Z7T1_9BILA
MLLTPTAASVGYALLFLMRIFQGIAISALLPASGSIVNEWSAITESGFAIAFLSCHQQLGQIFAMPISGLFCESSIGWQGIYYFLGFMTLIGFAFFFFFFRDTPRQHVNVSHDELEKITYDKDCNNFNENRKPPYLKIFKDKSILGIWIASIGGYTGFQLFSQYGPTYLNKVLDMDIQGTGFMAAAPFIGALAVKLISGPLSDKLTIISQQKRCIIFASISQFLMAFCIFALGWMPIKNEIFAKIAFTVAIMASSLNVVGVVKSAQLQSRQHAHVIMTVIAFINSVIVLLLPIFVSTLSPNNSPTEWPKIFYLIAILVTVTTIIFNFTCETDPRPWTRSNTSHDRKEPKN